MKFFIRKIFEDSIDELAHIQFIKYSRGEFKYKAMVAIKAQAKGIFKIGTTAEYGNELVRYMAEKVGDDEVKVSGALLTTQNLDGEFEYDEKKNALGVKKYFLDREMTGSKIIELLDKFPKCFFGLSMKFENTDLKIKPKSPKSPKPGNKADSEIKIDFCKIKTDDKELVKSLVFDEDNYKEVRISHTLMIDEIIVSDELKKEADGDYAKIKEMAKRKGKVVREITVDGVEKKKEKEFSA